MRRELRTPFWPPERLDPLRSGLRWLLGLGLLLCGVAQGEPTPAQVPAAVQIPLLLKILTFDLSLASIPPGAIRITVVGENGDASVPAVLAELHRFQDKTVGGRAIDVTTARPGEFPARGSKGGEVLCLTSSVESKLDALLSWAGEHSALTFSSEPAWVERGVALAIGAEQGHPKVFVNLPAARSEGRELDARLLALARVWR